MKRLSQANLADFAILGVLLAGCVFLSFATDKFLTSTNITNVLEQVSLIGIIAMGMTMLLVSGNFDLSIGGMVALIGVLSAQLMNSSGLVAGVALALVLGVALGTLNGLVVTKLKVNSLVATLGTGFAFSGTALLVCNASPVIITDTSLAEFVGGDVIGIPVPVIFFAAIVALSAWLLHFTIGGRELYAAGANAEAARYAGVRLNRVRFYPFVVTGLCCAIASLLLVGQLSTALPDAAQTWPLQVVAAVVVGGVSIAGGRGTILMAVVGVLLLGVVNNGFNLLSLDSSYQTVFTGVILVTAVAIDSALHERFVRRGNRRKPSATASTTHDASRAEPDARVGPARTGPAS